MADNSVSKIQFIESNRPGILKGDYKISVTQEIKTLNDQKIPAETFPASKDFQVLGERFELKPELFDSVFPPDGSLGDHSNTLPHAILNRSTLPWERSSVKGGQNAPWLAILLFEEAEKPEPHVMTLGELKSSSGQSPKFPAIDPESGQSDSDRVTVIDLKRSLLQRLLPAKSELSWLAHARQGKNAAGQKIGDEQAVIIANRLPARGAISTAHIVSLEGRYKGNDFDFQGAGNDDLIRLVSLKSWSFACLDKSQDFKGMLASLDLNPGTLRLPGSKNAEADKHLASGYVPLPHRFRLGGKSVSWYRGPLIPGENKTGVSLPVRASDELVLYERSIGMFDASYAAAWELGRLLVLQNKRVSACLYNWKRANAQHIARQKQQHTCSHLPAQAKAGQTKISAEVKTWFESLRILKDVPFNYLVPDERMLPVESIRFFWVDPAWVNCLIDGAFSVARVTVSDYDQDKALLRSIMPGTQEKITGLLLRSAVVAGWPGLIVEAYDRTQTRLEIERRDVLSDSVLMLLFKGEINSIKVHQKPEALHFGLDVTDSPNPEFYKKLRTDREKPEDGKTVAVTWRDKENRVINVGGLAGNIKEELKEGNFTSAQFALRMIEGGDEVTFRKNS